MSPSTLGSIRISEDLQGLRGVIALFSDNCNLNLADSSAVRRFVDGDFCCRQTPARDHQTCQDLRATLILLFRLEASSSEDLGIDGLRRLWSQHSDILGRFQGPKPMRGGQLLTSRHLKHSQSRAILLVRTVV